MSRVSGLAVHEPGVNIEYFYMWGLPSSWDKRDPTQGQDVNVENSWCLRYGEYHCRVVVKCPIDVTKEARIRTESSYTRSLAVATRTIMQGLE